MAKSASKSKSKVTEPEEITTLQSLEETTEVVDTKEEVTTLQPLEETTEVVNTTEEIVKSEEPVAKIQEFVPVHAHFPHGFFCAGLQKSYLPGFHVIKSAQELKLVRKFADNLK